MEIPDYLKGGQNLTDEESAELSALAQSGDAAAREKALLCHVRLAYRMARATRTRYVELEERFQEALTILDRCIMHFNASENVPFHVYAANQIRLRIMKAIEKERRAQAEKNPPQTTERQELILALRAQGLTYKQIASQLDLTKDVVEEEGARINEAFVAEALTPDVHIKPVRRSGNPGTGVRRHSIGVHHGAEGEAGDLDRLIRRAQKNGHLTETQSRVLRMRAAGRSILEIAVALGISEHSISEGYTQARRVLAGTKAC